MTALPSARYFKFLVCAQCVREWHPFVCIAVKMTQQTAFTHFYCRHPLDAFLFERLLTSVARRSEVLASGRAHSPTRKLAFCRICDSLRIAYLRLASPEKVLTIVAVGGTVCGKVYHTLWHTRLHTHTTCACAKRLRW